MQILSSLRRGPSQRPRHGNRGRERWTATLAGATLALLATMPLAAGTAAGAGRAEKEVRVGLVCYGGVSLAVYMHGITQELHKLVRASEAFHEDPTRNPFPAGSSERIYWRALQAKADQEGVSTRVVIDSIAGTSAGGINGVLLARALAHDLSQENLPEFWFNRADIRTLTGCRFQWTAALTALYRLQRNRAIFSGAPMLEWLREALDGMQPGSRPGGRGTLLPDDHPLDLQVTTTDFYGARRTLAVSNLQLEEKANAQVLQFRFNRPSNAQDTRAAVDHFDAAHVPLLAFAARATSSFPVAFTPVGLKDFPPGTSLPQGFQRTFFRHYELAGNEVLGAYFVDGGLRQNAPFAPVIKGLFKRPAAQEVERVLVYLEPDPVGAVQPGGDRPRPKAWQVGLASVATIPAAQPILDSLQEVREHNDRVEMIQNILQGESIGARAKARAATVLARRGRREAGSALAPLRRISEQGAASDREVGDPTYLRLRTESVLQQFAVVVNRLEDYPEDSTQADLVHRIIRAWADHERYSGANPDAGKQRLLRQRFDLGYVYRRVRMVGQYLNRSYRSTALPAGRRRQLDAAKAALQAQAEAIRGVMRGGIGTDSDPLVQDIRQLFAADPKDRRPLAEQVQAFLQDPLRRQALASIEKQLGDRLEARMDQWYEELDGRLETLTEPWSEPDRTALYSYYHGFPELDAEVYPVQRMAREAGGGELEPITVLRFSPLDAKAIPIAGAKLEGTGLAHFRAFLARAYRENDYLWGRLDGLERIFTLLGRETDPLLRDGLVAVVDSEAPRLRAMDPRRLAAIKSALGMPPAAAAPAARE